MSGAGRIEYFQTERFFFRIGGISFNQQEGFLYKIYSWAVVLLIFILYPIISVVDLSKRGFNDALKDWFYFLGCVMDSSILINILFIRKSFERALRTFEKPSFFAQQHRGAYEEESKILKDWLSKSVRYNYIFILLMLLVTVSQMLHSLIWRIIKSNDSDRWFLPFGSIKIVDFKVSPNFEILWFYQSAVITILDMSIAPLVMVIIGSLTFLSVQLKMLQNYLKRMTQLAMEQGTFNETNLNRHLSNAVEYHLDIINAVQAIKQVFHGLFLIMFIYTLSFLCINIYRTSQAHTFDVNMLLILAESTTVFFPTLIVCYYGEKLTHESEQVGAAAYEIDFVGTDLGFQRALLLLIQRSQKTLQIKAGHMIGASLDTAVWIIRSAFSAYMMLRTINSDQMDPNQEL